MDKTKDQIKEAFNQVFSSKDKYFGEWYISTSDELFGLLEEYQKSNQIDLFKQLRYLYLYLESLEVLKQQAQKENWTIANVLSNELWYCNVLLLLIGLTDQHTKREVDENGKIKKLGERFKVVMFSLKENEQNHLLSHYGGPRKHKDFEELVMHIFSTRTFFAHEIIQPENSVPQDGFFAFGSGENLHVIYPNLPYGRLFLYIIIALMRYIGFAGDMEIKSDEKFEKITDFLRTA